MVKVYTLISSLFLSQMLLGQCLVQKIALPDRIDQSDCVVEGKVVHQYCFEEAKSGHLLMANELEVYQVFKGDPKTDKVTVFTLGGVLDGRVETATPSLQFHVGQVAIVMLKDYSELKAAYPINLGEVSGFWGVNGPASTINFDIASGRAVDFHETFPTIKGLRIDLEDLTDQKATIKHVYQVPILGSNKKAGISSFSPTTVTGGTKTTLVIKGTGFGSAQGTVYFSNPDDGGNTLIPYSDSAHIEKWGDKRIEVLVPQRAGTGKFRVETSGKTQYASTTDLTVSYSRMEIVSLPPKGSGVFSKKVYLANLENDNGNGGYTWSLNDDFKKMDPRATKAVMRALEEWRCATSIDFDIDTTTTTSVDQKGTDGVHTIMWQNANQTINPGALGVTFNFWSGCFVSSTKDWHWYLNNVDMVYDEQLATGFSWNFKTSNPGSKQYDFESVVLHELGHAHQLGHINDASGVMHYSIKNGEKKRALSTNSDIAAGLNVISTSATSACLTSQMTPHEAIKAADCKILNLPKASVTPNFDRSENAICLGDTITLTSTTDPSTSTLKWSFPAGVNIIDSKQGKSIMVLTFDATGDYDLELEATNGSATGSISKRVTVNAIPKISTNISHVSCQGAKDGKIQVVFDEGEAPFVLEWSDDSSDDNPKRKLSGATYKVTVTDNFECKLVEDIVVDEPQTLFIMGSGGKAASGGADNGYLWVQIFGGTPPYIYQWDDDAAQTTDTAFNLAPGDYVIEIKDKNGCETKEFLSVDIISSQHDLEAQFIYPNPTNDWVYISNTNGTYEHLVVYDSNGKVVMETALGSSGNQIDLSQLISGCYIVTVSGNKDVSHHALVKF